MNATDTRTTTEVATPRPATKLARPWGSGTAMAVLLVAAAYLLADTGSDRLVVTGTGEITLNNVIGFTILGSIVGALLALVVGRSARRPRLTFCAVALIALAGYAVVPFTAAATTRTAIWLNIFHLVVAIPVIGMLTRYLPTNGTSIEA